MSRRRWMASAIACLPDDRSALGKDDLPEAAQAIAAELGLTDWSAYRTEQQRTLTLRIDEGSAEHVTYYVLQSRSFTKEPPIDPVRLAATKPVALTEGAARRFADFAEARGPFDERHAIIRGLSQNLPGRWTPEACFLHTMRFLEATAEKEKRDGLYYQRGLSADTSPRQTQVIDRALAALSPLKGRTLLAGPGLDLTRREGFSDATPLRSYQVDRLLQVTAALDCADVRPEVLAHLRTRPVCPLELDLSTTAASTHGRYSLAIATNVLLYLDDRSLFAALAGFARSLAPGGHLVHNDSRFAAKFFGEALGLPVIRFEPISLGRSGGTEMMDRVVIHRCSN